MNCPSWLRIRRLETASDQEIEGLSDVLRDCVEGGASVGFMLPLTRGKAEAFWRGASASAARGERVVLVAEEQAGAIVGTSGDLGAVRKSAASRSPEEIGRAHV